MTQEKQPPVDELSRNKRQQLFTRYTLAVLIDLTVLNLFNEYWDYVFIATFTISLLVAILLQFLLQVAIKIEHYAASFFDGISGKKAKTLRIVSAWVILFISKIVMMEAINMVFGERVLFTGPIHGVVVFITVVVAIIIAEQVFLKIYRSLA